MLADIARGETATADVFFLIAVILFAIATLLSIWPFERVPGLLLIAAGLTFTGLGLLVL
jgi:hypothetical protein